MGVVLKLFNLSARNKGLLVGVLVIKNFILIWLAFNCGWGRFFAASFSTGIAQIGNRSG